MILSDYIIKFFIKQYNTAIVGHLKSLITYIAHKWISIHIIKNGVFICTTILIWWVQSYINSNKYVYSQAFNV